MWPEMGERKKSEKQSKMTFFSLSKAKSYLGVHLENHLEVGVQERTTIYSFVGKRRESGCEISDCVPYESTNLCYKTLEIQLRESIIFFQ